MGIIGRQNEQIILQECLDSGKSEFLVVYGRRRVGKTYLIKEFFDNRFSFYATGVNGLNLKDELDYFNDSLIEYGLDNSSRLNSWREAFNRLKMILTDDSVVRDPLSGKRIVFLDELPWMDTPRSGFRSALDHFWNSWASAQKDILLIVCGSAASWIINNILTDTGGFFNRITRQIHLRPFTLGECESFLKANDCRFNRDDIINCYMIFGGIPYYLDLISRRMSLAQNIDALIFSENGQLHYEYDRLFGSLFRNSDKHIAIMKALAIRRCGLTRKDIIADTGISDGELLTKALSELEQCGFIRKYKNYTMDKKSTIFQIIDPFVLFYYSFLDSSVKSFKKGKINSWMNYIRTPGYNVWCGLSFEILCLNHVSHIKRKLGIAGVDSIEYSWRSKNNGQGAQIDLIIDRMDNVMNICEMKYSTSEYVIDKSYAQALKSKLDVFENETHPRKSLHLTMICSNGLKRNEYSSIALNVITGEDLF